MQLLTLCRFSKPPQMTPPKLLLGFRGKAVQTCAHVSPRSRDYYKCHKALPRTIPIQRSHLETELLNQAIFPQTAPHLTRKKGYSQSESCQNHNPLIVFTPSFLLKQGANQKSISIQPCLTTNHTQKSISSFNVLSLPSCSRNSQLFGLVVACHPQGVSRVSTKSILLSFVQETPLLALDKCPECAPS